MQDLYSWIGFIIFWGAAVLGLLGLLLATAVVCGWHVFGHRILTDVDYELQQARIERVYEAHRWLAPFNDLDPIWDHIFYGGDVAQMREKLAKERGVTVYNEPIATPEQEKPEPMMYMHAICGQEHTFPYTACIRCWDISPDSVRAAAEKDQQG